MMLKTRHNRLRALTAIHEGLQYLTTLLSLCRDVLVRLEET